MYSPRPPKDRRRIPTFVGAGASTTATGGGDVENTSKNNPLNNNNPPSSSSPRSQQQDDNGQRTMRFVCAPCDRCPLLALHGHREDDQEMENEGEGGISSIFSNEPKATTKRNNNYNYRSPIKNKKPQKRVDAPKTRSDVEKSNNGRGEKKNSDHRQQKGGETEDGEDGNGSGGYFSPKDLRRVRNLDVTTTEAEESASRAVIHGDQHWDFQEAILHPFLVGRAHIVSALRSTLENDETFERQAVVKDYFNSLYRSFIAFALAMKGFELEQAESVARVGVWQSEACALLLKLPQLERLHRLALEAEEAAVYPTLVDLQLKEIERGKIIWEESYRRTELVEYLEEKEMRYAKALFHFVRLKKTICGLEEDERALLRVSEEAARRGVLATVPSILLSENAVQELVEQEKKATAAKRIQRSWKRCDATMRGKEAVAAYRKQQMEAAVEELLAAW